MNGNFARALSGEREVQIEFAKKDGRKRKIPVWFSVSGDTVELLPMYGLKTKWFEDVERTGRMELESRGTRVAASPTISRDAKEVDAIKARFAAKYGEAEVRRYYPTSEVALKITL